VAYNADSGHREDLQWLDHCDQGSIYLGRERWSWTHDPSFEQPAEGEGAANATNATNATNVTVDIGTDGAISFAPGPGNETGSWTKIDFTVSCVAPYSAMAGKWQRWQGHEGVALRKKMESNSYDKQFEIMQEAWQQWKTWETGMSIYSASKITVEECARTVNGTGMAAQDPALLTSGFRAYGHKSVDCSLAQCDIDQCVKKTTKCSLGESLDEVEYDCIDRIRVTHKTLDELLIGIFLFFLSLLVFIGAFYTDDPLGQDRGLLRWKKGNKVATDEVIVTPKAEDTLRGTGIGSDDEEEALHKRKKTAPVGPPPKRNQGASLPGQVEQERGKDR